MEAGSRCSTGVPWPWRTCTWPPSAWASACTSRASPRSTSRQPRSAPTCSSTVRSSVASKCGRCRSLEMVCEALSTVSRSSASGRATKVMLGATPLGLKNDESIGVTRAAHEVHVPLALLPHLLQRGADVEVAANQAVEAVTGISQSPCLHAAADGLTAELQVRALRPHPAADVSEARRHPRCPGQAVLLHQLVGQQAEAVALLVVAHINGYQRRARARPGALAAAAPPPDGCRSRHMAGSRMTMSTSHSE
jgi:hypothetical protein